MIGNWYLKLGKIIVYVNVLLIEAFISKVHVFKVKAKVCEAAPANNYVDKFISNYYQANSASFSVLVHTLTKVKASAEFIEFTPNRRPLAFFVLETIWG